MHSHIKRHEHINPNSSVRFIHKLGSISCVSPASQCNFGFFLANELLKPADSGPCSDFFPYSFSTKFSDWLKYESVHSGSLTQAIKKSFFKPRMLPPRVPWREQISSHLRFADCGALARAVESLPHTRFSACALVSAVTSLLLVCWLPRLFPDLAANIDGTAS